MVAQAADGASMDDILSSIRSSVEEEQEKVASGEAQATPLEGDGADDVLELTPDEMVQSPEDEKTIDIGTFNAAGDVNDVVTAPTPQPTPEPQPGGDAADEFDRLLAEISVEKEHKAAAVEAQKALLLADDEPLGGPVDAPGVLPLEPVAHAEPEPVYDAAEPPVAATAPAAGGSMVASMASDGLNLVLPAEVLAMALRPMVQEWLNANLSGVVERLVQAEIAKLNQQM